MVRALITYLILFVSTLGQAQDLLFESGRGIGIQNNIESGVFDNNQSYRLSFIFKSHFGLGAEIRTIDWGNQGSFFLCYTYPLLLNENMNVSLQWDAILSMPFYQNGNKLSIGSGLYSVVQWPLYKQNTGKASVGLRYDRIFNYPGRIDRTLEIPILIGIVRNGIFN